MRPAGPEAARPAGPLRRALPARGLIVFAIVALAIGAALAGLFRPVDNLLTDWRFAVTGRTPTGSVVFVEIDPASLRRIGVWPWPRHVYADLLDRLMALGAAETVLDIDFSSATSPAEDAAFEAALRRAGGFALLAGFRQFSPVSNRIEITLPLARLLAVAEPVMVNVVAEQDGVVRRYPAGLGTGHGHVPSLAEALSGLPLAEGGSVYLDYGIDASLIDRISVADVLAGTVDPARIAGRQVVVGASAQELRDLFTVPRFGTVPGGLLQILAAETLKQHRGLQVVGRRASLALVVVFGLAFLVLGSRLPLRVEVAAGLAGLLLSEAAALVLQAEAGLLLRTAPADAALLALLLAAVLQELESRRRLHAAAARERDAMRRILDRVVADNFDGVVVIEQSGRVIAASRIAERLLGGGQPLAGQRFAGALPQAVADAVERSLGASGETAASGPAEVTVGTPGARRTLEYVVTRSELSGADDTLRRVACLTFRDITERRSHEQRLAFLAGHDALTGALSRPSFVAAVEQALEADADRDQGLTVVVVELGRFRIVNDMLGHAIGDRVLKEVVRRLDTGDRLAAGRVGGDSFAVARRGRLAPAAALRFAEGIVTQIVEPYDIDGRRAVLSAHAGVTTTDLSGFDGDTLLAHADMALSLVKGTPGNAVRLFAPSMTQRLADRQRIEASLREAIEQGRFEMHYQPQIALATGALAGVEALLRWRDPGLGQMSPAVFIPVAEETGLIVELGRFALETACRDLADWPQSVRLAVNVSPVQFELDDMARVVRGALALSGMPASRLDLELTEGLFVGNTHPANQALQQLRPMGVGVALDDFGTGYSSLSYLGRLPVDTIKIDRSFIASLPADAEALAIVRSVLDLSRSLGKKTVAEGIETAAQAELIAGLGCDLGQGYHFDKALPIAELRARYAPGPRRRLVGHG